MLQKLQISKTTTFSESSGRQLSHGTPLYRSYPFKSLSNLRLSFPSFGVFWRFQHRAPDIALLNHWSWPFEPFHWIFVWFHIVCDRYTQDNAHFTYFNTIWPLSPSSNFGTAFITSPHILSYSDVGYANSLKYLFYRHPIIYRYRSNITNSIYFFIHVRVA